MIDPGFNKTDVFKKVVWACVMTAIALCLYFALSRDIRIALWPHTKILRLFYGIEFSFVPDVGYLAQQHNFQITWDCSGMKLFVGMFLVATLGFAPYAKGRAHMARYACKMFFATLTAAFVISIFRIALSLAFCNAPNAQLMHNITSLILFFGSIAILFWLLQRKQEKQNHESERI